MDAMRQDLAYRRLIAEADLRLSDLQLENARKEWEQRRRNEKLEERWFREVRRTEDAARTGSSLSGSDSIDGGGFTGDSGSYPENGAGDGESGGVVENAGEEE